MRDLTHYIADRLRQPGHGQLVAGLICLIIVPVVMTFVLLFGEWQLQHKADQAEKLRGGVCHLLVSANEQVPQTKAFFEGQAHRAKIRLQADKQLGLTNAVAADRDAIAQAKLIANRQKQINLSQFGC